MLFGDSRIALNRSGDLPAEPTDELLVDDPMDIILGAGVGEPDDNGLGFGPLLGRVRVKVDADWVGGEQHSLDVRNQIFTAYQLAVAFALGSGDAWYDNLTPVPIALPLIGSRRR